MVMEYIFLLNRVDTIAEVKGFISLIRQKVHVVAIFKNTAEEIKYSREPKGTSDNNRL